MTLDEAIKHAEEIAEEKENEGKLLCQSEGASIGCLTCAEEHRQLADWLKDYKRLKEQEPCEDVTTFKEDVLDAISRIGLQKSGTEAVRVVAECLRAVEALPPVTPQEPKTGHWIEDAKTYYEELNKRGLGVDEYTPYFTDDIACSECLAKYSMLDNETQFFKHCPNCGAKMVEIPTGAESEDKK